VSAPHAGDGFFFFQRTVPVREFCESLDTLGLLSKLDGFTVVWREPHYRNGL